MTIETKVLNAYNNPSYEGTKEEFIKFGWQHTEDTQVKASRGYTLAYVLVRDKDMPNYQTLVELENKYLHLKLQRKTYSRIDGGWCLVAFLCFIVPGIIYVTVKSKQKRKIKNHNEEIQRQMNEILSQAKALL